MRRRCATWLFGTKKGTVGVGVVLRWSKNWKSKRVMGRSGLSFFWCQRVLYGRPILFSHIFLTSFCNSDHLVLVRELRFHWLCPLLFAFIMVGCQSLDPRLVEANPFWRMPFCAVIAIALVRLFLDHQYLYFVFGPRTAAPSCLHSNSLHSGGSLPYGVFHQKMTGEVTISSSSFRPTQFHHMAVKMDAISFEVLRWAASE